MKFRTLTVAIALTATLLFSHNASAMEAVSAPVLPERYTEWSQHTESCEMPKPDGRVYTITGYKRKTAESGLWHYVVTDSLDGKLYAVDVSTFNVSIKSDANVFLYQKNSNDRHDGWLKFETVQDGVHQSQNITAHRGYTLQNERRLFGANYRFFLTETSGCREAMKKVYNFVKNTQ